MEYDIYGMDKRIEYFQKKLDGMSVPQENKDQIREFFEYLFAKGISKSRILIYSNRLVPLAAMFGQLKFKEATQKDMQRIVSQVERTAWSPMTKEIYRITLKRFYKWLLGNDEFYPECVRWMKKSGALKTKIMPEELLTTEEIHKMIDEAKNPRDKAFIAVLADSGCRVGEIASMKIKHVSFDQYGAQVMVCGKTGQRRIRLISSVHFLTQWLENHPFKHNPESSLWPRLTTKSRGQPMNYVCIMLLLKKAKKAAGVKKRVNPHSYRHARATELAKMGLNEPQMEKIMGWEHGSSMPQVYLHMSGNDVDSALLKAYGLQPKEDQDTRLKCPRCFMLSDIKSTFCKECGMPLTTRAAVDMENNRQKFEDKISKVMEMIENDAEVQKLITSKLKKRVA